MTDISKEAVELFLIEKRGLYYRPDAAGYTALKIDAGRYDLEGVALHMPNMGGENQDGMTFISEHEAPDVSHGAPFEARLEWRARKAEMERDAQAARIEELEAQCVSVKPLVWERADLSAWGESAGNYVITWDYGSGPNGEEVFFTVRIEGVVLHSGWDETLTKQAAQDHHNALKRNKGETA